MDDTQPDIAGISVRGPNLSTTYCENTWLTLGMLRNKCVKKEKEKKKRKKKKERKRKKHMDDNEVPLEKWVVGIVKILNIDSLTFTV